MKKIAFTALIAIALLTGCSDKENTPPQVNENENSQADHSSEQSEKNQENTTNNDSKDVPTETGKKEKNGNKQASIESEQEQSKDQQKENDSTTDKGNKDSIPVVANPQSISVMINKSNALPKGYRANDLVRPKVKFVFGNEKLDKALMRAEAATALEKMFNQAASQGIHLFAASGFRSYETQELLFKREIEQVGREKAELAVAFPGTSEHQTGLAMDISAASVNYKLTESFENKKEGKWLAEHAHEFGFILRYPKGKEDITKYQFEPWHFRYVGKEIASEIYEKKITLEEYYENKKGV